MEKYRAIPAGYMTVGQAAKKMNTTVRTLQYYDRVGLLSPSAESEGGRRLYTHKDIVRLHQIQSFKYLGFSLDDIKFRLVSLDTPEEVANALTEQAAALREKISALTEILDATEKLKAETLQMKTVDFERYADIVALLRQKNEHYWVAKHFGNKLWGHIRGRFDEKSGETFFENFRKLCAEAVACKNAGEPPESPRAQKLAGEWWAMVTDFTGGDMSLLPELTKFSENLGGSWSGELKGLMAEAAVFIGPVLEVYFQRGV
ncbi:MAG: MerR family transcriptional regulator [Clostridiales bacterium]|jgi:DNA-binding transcriptional MerR regulator|nr:MerR family transcriptional regulator [Clostridiales bacterium]